MKKLFLLLLFFTLVSSHLAPSAYAYTERFRVVTDEEGNKHCRTNKVNITNERDPFLCIYTLADRIDGKPSATLSWEVSLTTNETAHAFGQQILAVTRDLAGPGKSRVVLSLYLSNGDRIYFDGSTLKDFNKKDWHPLIHVSRENGELSAFLMFPIEYCWSDKVQLSKNPKKRYKYIMKLLQQYNIQRVAFTDIYRDVRIESEFRLARPTAETIRKMIKKAKEKEKPEE